MSQDFPLQGFIKLHRQIQENPIWTAERFSKAQAWVDLILLAQWKDTRFLWGNELIEIKRGQLLTTQVFLAQRWQWNRKTVANFLHVLEKAKMAGIAKVRAADNGYTLLSIQNYNKFQGDHDEHADSALPSGADIGRTAGSQCTRSIKNREEDKKRKRAAKPQRSRFVLDDFVITEELKSWAKKERPDLDIEREIAKFRDHEFRTPRSDWPRTWRNWIRGAKKENGRDRSDTVGQSQEELTPEQQKALDETRRKYWETHDDVFAGIDEQFQGVQSQ